VKSPRPTVFDSDLDPPKQLMPVRVRNSDPAISVSVPVDIPFGNCVTPFSDEGCDPGVERLQRPNARLLVSVRNQEEAIAAIQGGADIIDVKEPHHGSLGRAATNVIRSIADMLRLSHRTIRLSVALGELTELTAAGNLTRHEISISLAPRSGSFLKIGLAGTASQNAGGWQNQLLSIREEIGFSNRWVAVAYADHIRAASPTPLEICEFAIHSGCHAFLIDTFVKDSHTLTSWLSDAQLSTLIQRARAAGLVVALAGSVSANDLLRLIPLGPDLIAVRGAVCEGTSRLSSVSADRVADFRRAMRESSAASPNATQSEAG
jgi:uncharacterized protein (UPF0264 family)